MRYVYILACLCIAITVTAQKPTDPAELYPVFKSLKVKWDKNADYIYAPPVLNECINGNCTDAEGVKLITTDLKQQYGAYRLYGTIFKGRFSEGGSRFTGKVYKFELPAGGHKKEKELRIGTPLDITDESAMKPFYVGEGSYYLGNDRWNNGWDGEVKDLPALAKTFPDGKVHKAMFNKGSLAWIDIDLPATHPFIRYTGHTFASGDFMLGKAVLDNGDVYEGFFLRHSFHGPGKLTKRSGKVLQGIWQVDSLTQDVAVQFPTALLQGVLPKPAWLKASELNDWKPNGSANFYGEVVNNEATGWGLWISDNYTPLYAYGYWQHNLLEGPGIYFTSPRASQLSYEAGNKTTFENDFRINTGVYKNGKAVQGNSIATDYSVYANRDNAVGELPRLSLEKIFLSTYPLQGCGMQAELWYSTGYQSKPSVFTIKEGHYTDGKLTGFYFEDDKEKKRSYEFLRFAGYNAYQSFTENIIKTAEASNSFCFDAMSRYKSLFVAEMKKKLEGNIAAEAWAKSPEGLAHKQRVEQANREYEARRKKECEEEFAKIGVKGRTYTYRASLVILEGYDCAKKEYIAWRPRQGNDLYSDPAMTQIRGLTGFGLDKLTPSVKQYHTCEECNGTGKVLVTVTTTRTKELPFGYFSGIETKSIRTTTKEESRTCGVCKGAAILLK